MEAAAGGRAVLRVCYGVYLCLCLCLCLCSCTSVCVDFVCAEFLCDGNVMGL